MAFHLEARKVVMSNSWVLAAIRGYMVEFITEPKQSPFPVSVESGVRTQAITQEVKKLVQKGAVVEIAQAEARFGSRIFLVPKRADEASDQPEADEPIS